MRAQRSSSWSWSTAPCAPSRSTPTMSISSGTPWEATAVGCWADITRIGSRRSRRAPEPRPRSASAGVGRWSRSKKASCRRCATCSCPSIRALTTRACRRRPISSRPRRSDPWRRSGAATIITTGRSMVEVTRRHRVGSLRSWRRSSSTYGILCLSAWCGSRCCRGSGSSTGCIGRNRGPTPSSWRTSTARRMRSRSPVIGQPTACASCWTSASWTRRRKWSFR